MATTERCSDMPSPSLAPRSVIERYDVWVADSTPMSRKDRGSGTHIHIPSYRDMAAKTILTPLATCL
jgi:hypothetical protein